MIVFFLMKRKAQHLHFISAFDAIYKREYPAKMPDPDFNLLIALDTLLAEGSVAKAARKLQLSPSAMSRTLTRLRITMGDPLLVRAGRGLVPTLRALEIQENVQQLVQEVRILLRPTERLDLTNLSRTFILRTSDGFVENFGPDLISRLAKEAPKVKLRFIPKADKESPFLRDGTIDLETGVRGPEISPEILTQSLFQDRFIGIVRKGHPLSKGKVTLARYIEGQHIIVSRRTEEKGPIDEPLVRLGKKRNIAIIVGGFSAALALARSSDLIATLPERHTSNLRLDMHSFPLPFPLPDITVSLFWHPRMDADPAHRWLRHHMREVCNKNSKNRG